MWIANTRVTSRFNGKGILFMSKEKLEDIITASKLNSLFQKKEEETKAKKCCNAVFVILAVIGAVAAVAGIAYAVYRYFTPDYLEDFDDEYEDDFEDDFFEDDFDE